MNRCQPVVNREATPDTGPVKPAVDAPPIWRDAAATSRCCSSQPREATPTLTGTTSISAHSLGW